jgi:hypothetical protein
MNSLVCISLRALVEPANLSEHLSGSHVLHAVSGVMDQVIEYLRENCSKGREVTEASLLDAYEKLCVGIDTMISSHVCRCRFALISDYS